MDHDQSDQAPTDTTRAAFLGPVFVFHWNEQWQHGEGFPDHGASDRFHWVHSDRTQDVTRSWISSHPAIPEQARHALLEEDTRPRVDRFDDGLLVIMRAVELTPGSAPDELISLRMWLDDRRLITLRSKRVLAPAQLQERITGGYQVHSPAQLLVDLCTMITANLGELIEDIAEAIGDLEERAIEGTLLEGRDLLTSHQRRIVAFRRHMTPQAFALARLRECAFPGMDGFDHQLRELEHRSLRIQEELHQLAERSLLLKSEVGDALNQQVEQRMRLLTVLGAIFLPLSFITGLLGINVGGIPGADTDLAFWMVCGAMALLLIAQLAWLRWRRWI